MKTPLRLYSDAIKDGQVIPDPVQEHAVDILEKLHQNLIKMALKRKSFSHKILGKKGQPPKSVYMFGDVGRGKSMLMDLFASCSPLPTRTSRVHFHQFMQDIHTQLHELRQDGANTSDALAPIAAKMAKEIDILCFDEFFVTNIADAMILQRLLELLLKHRIVLVATSNRHPDALYKNGLQRERFMDCIELIKEKFEIVEVNGKTDYRTTKQKEDTKYLYPLNNKNTETLRALFKKHINNKTPRAKKIIAKGREIKIAQSGKKTAYVTFDEMCRENRGTSDFLAITKNFDTLFLEGIPQLKDEDRNEASRFVTLVDTLYEKKINFYCSAATPPDELYVKGEGSFEFQRTASRLKEMSSQNWQKTD